MPLPLIVPIPAKTYTVGVSTLGPAVVPAGASSLLVTLATAQWTNPLARLTLVIEVSFDNGQTWLPGGIPFQDVGPNASGVFPGKGGVGTQSTIAGYFSWPPDVTTLQGTLTIAGASVKTSGSLTVN